MGDEAGKGARKLVRSKLTWINLRLAHELDVVT